MGDYIAVPITALFCYIFLFMTMLAAQKNRIINSFLLILVALLFWTGGSFFMRMQFWPSIKVWFDISILGLLLLGFALFNFAYQYVGCKNRAVQLFWFMTTVVINLINICTGVFLREPELVETASGQTSFVYNTTWPVVAFFIFCTAIIAHMFVLLFRYFKDHEVARRQFHPVLVGIGFMFLGHIAFIFPFFKGIPTDIIAGVPFAFCIFYALYRRRLFRLTLLASRGSCYALSAGLSVIVFINLLRPLADFIHAQFPMLGEYDTLIIALTFTVFTCLVYFCMKKFIDNVFVKEEIVQAENLKAFSLAVSRSLQIDEILNGLVDIIQKTIAVERVYVCVPAPDKQSYRIIRSSSPLDRPAFSLGRDNPVVLWLKEHDECLLLSEFRRTTAYKSMWEAEKRALEDLGIECLSPLKDKDSLVGIVLLATKDKGRRYSYEDLNYHASVNSISSIAVKNSRLYERAYLEARTDELTGLLNRKYFYETLQNAYDEHRDEGLSLIILNLDDFKLYNQLYGNKEGDIALQKVARLIQASVGEHGHVARYSGKEFAIILPGYDLLSAKELAENIRRQILDMNKAATDYTLKVLTVSGGVCAIPHAASTVKELIDNADMAVYHVKHNGKNAILAYTTGDYRFEKASPETADRHSAYSEYESTIYALTATIDTKDHYTFNHSNNVAHYATELARAIHLNADHVEMIREAALLHDIGKIGIPEHILNKPGRLTEEEYEVMKSHVENSIGIIRHLPSLDYVIPSVIGHHEHYDGKGYPRRIAGEDIPLGARILCIADSFDAMISQRSYKQPYPLEKALHILLEEAGRQFDPQLVPVFVELVRSGRVQVPENGMEPS